jgi:4-amino-4-deoxy-L-arabinose transferase-like glycosyltransferase
MAHPHERGVLSWLGDGLLLAASLILYISTLAPTILPADSGEFQLVSYVLGIAHPPGYPLYTMLGKVFTLIPLHDVAYRVNLLSAFTSALTLLVLSRAVRRLTGSTMAGMIAAAVLGVAPTFWAQATTANIRSLTALFVALQLYTLVTYAQTKNSRDLVAFAAVLGLGVTHHSSLVPLVLPYLLFLALADASLLRKPRSWIRPVLAFLLSLCVLLYLPLRSAMGAPFDPQPIRSLSAFLDHVLALGFRGDMFYFVQPMAVLARLRVLWNILMLEFGLTWLLLGMIGAASLLIRRPKELLLCSGVFAINALLAVTYRAPQTVEYLMPAYVALTCISAYGVWNLAEHLGARRLSALAWVVALLLPAVALARDYSSFQQISQDRSAREYAEGVLLGAPQSARVLANWHYATPLWYLQLVEHVRPDVDVVYVYPEGAEPIAQTWLRHLQESAAQRPTIVTNQYPEFGNVPYTFQPLAGAYLVQTGPVYATPSGVRALQAVFDGRIELVGYELTPTVLSPADSLTARVYWKPAVKLDRDYSFFVHLVDANGVPLGQGDTTHPAARYAVGQVLLDEYHIPLLPTVQPGRYRVIAGVYITLAEGGWRRLTMENGQDTVELAEVEVRPLSTAPVTLHALSRPFACGYTLLGVDYDHSVPDQLRVYLHWRVGTPPRALGGGGPPAAQQWQVVLFSQGVAATAAALPTMPAGSYFTTAHDLPPAATGLALEVQSAADQAPSRWLGPLGLPLGHRVNLPVPASGARYLALGGEMVLVKAEYPQAAQSGSSLRVRLTFVGAKPITNDYTVSVSLVDENGALLAQHDGTPALGAIPTLKWIHGSTVLDEHELLLPLDAAGRSTLRLTVYDAFTIKSLPVLDERLARIGQGTQVTLGALEIAESQ